MEGLVRGCCPSSLLSFEMKKIIWLLAFLYAGPGFSQGIFDAARNNDTIAIQHYIQEALPLDTVDEKGYSPLILACYNENIKAARLLLAAGANPNVQDKSGNSALMGVAFKGYATMADLLLQHGAEIDQQNYNAATALIFAATFGHEDIVQLLLRYNADRSLQDRFGKTALSHAQMQENEGIIALLK